MLRCALKVCVSAAVFTMEDRVQRAWTALPSQAVRLPWETFLDGTFLPLPLALDFDRPTAVPVTSCPAEPPAKKARPETFSKGGSVAIKVSAKPWHEDDRRAAAL